VADGNGVPSASQDGEVVLTQYTIYERPADYPDGFVVRQWHVVRGRDEPVPGEAATAATLGDARALVPDGLFNLGRQPGDDSTIVETWT
jgi:hypothetical protein